MHTNRGGSVAVRVREPPRGDAHAADVEPQRRAGQPRLVGAWNVGWGLRAGGATYTTTYQRLVGYCYLDGRELPAEAHAHVAAVRLAADPPVKKMDGWMDLGPGWVNLWSGLSRPSTHSRPT